MYKVFRLIKKIFFDRKDTGKFPNNSLSPQKNISKTPQKS